MRNARLDFLRFIGVALVMFNHLEQTGSGLIGAVLARLNNGGWIGVDIFFVLSGFLVSGLIFKEYDRYQSFHPGHFLIRRGFKIYPTFYIFLALSFTGTIVMSHHLPPAGWAGLWHEAIFISNYTSFNNGLLWSICVEEHFYIFLSILFFFLIKYRKLTFNYILGTYLILFLSTFFFRYQNYLRYNDYEFFRDYTPSHFRVDALFFGVLLFYVYNYHKPRLDKFLKSRFNYIFLICSILFVLTDFFMYRGSHRWMAVINPGIHPWLFGCIMINFLEWKTTKADKWLRPFSYVGMYSYPIYLFHGRINVVAYQFFSGPMYYIVFFGLSIVVGIFMSKVVEYPVLRFRDKYFPSRSKGLVPAEKKQPAGEQVAAH